MASVTYFKTVMLGVDDSAAAALLNRNNISISAAAGLVAYCFDAPLKLHPWQRWFLHQIYWALDYFWPRHCEEAVIGDRARALATQQLLEGAAKYFSETVTPTEEL